MAARLTLLRPPAPPPPTAAGVNAERQYWRGRLQKNVADVDAYIRLGVLEDKEGFYTAATKYLRAARALGAPDMVICAPLGRALTRLARDDEALPELEKAAKLAPDSLDGAANLAGLYINQNESQMAAAVLKRFADAHQPIRDVAQAERLALCFQECGYNASARAMAQRTLEIMPNNMVARGVAARAALTQKDFPAAQRYLEAMRAQAPDDGAILYLYGAVLEAQGDHDGALKQWQKTVTSNPNAYDAYERIGNAYARRGDMRHAAIAYETIALRDQSRDTAVRVAAALSHIENQTPIEKGKSAYWNAVAAGFMGDFSAALRLSRIAAANPATRRLGLQAMAEAYRGMSKKQPYIALLQKVTAGGSVDDLLLMAQAWGEADEPVKQTACLLRCLAKAPLERRAAIHGELAKTYRRRGMRDEAERELEQALEQSPRDATLHRQLAEVYFQRRMVKDRLKKAISEWETAIALDPNDETDWQRLGSAYVAAGDTGKAVRSLEHAIDLEPGYGAAYLELGRTYAGLGDKASSKYMLGLYAKFVAYDQQRQTLGTRARRDQASVEDVLAYGNFMRKAGFMREAITQYEKALSLRPGDNVLRARLAALYGRLGMTDRQARIGSSEARTRGGS